MPAKSKTSGSWSENQPRYVEIPLMNQDVRPQLEKMISCDFSVEESFTTNDTCEQDIIKTICGFPKKPVRDRCPPFSLGSWLGFPNSEEAVATYKKIGRESTSRQDDSSSFKCDLEEKEAAFKKLGFESTIWKVGAVESEKSRSPTEHDDRDEPKSIEDKNVVSEQDENPSFLEKYKSQTCTENLEVQSKEATMCENLFQVKRKSTAKKKKSKSPLKRQSIGKKKRNKWVILCDEEPLKPARQKKVTVSNKTCIVKANKKHHSTSQCKDSGVSSGSSYDSGSASGGDSGSQDYDGKNGGGGEGGGGGCGGGSGFRRNGGMGGAGRGDDSEEKRPFSSGDTEMKDEEDTEDDRKMKSKGSSDMDCEDDSLEQDSVEWQSLHFQTQHLQHSCYCSRDGCDRPLCVQMKRELKHLKEKLSEHCQRCQKIVNLLKLHAATCQRPGCRVPNCPELRARKEAQPPQAAKDQYKNIQKAVPSHIPPSTDGQVLYCKLPLCGGLFQENINYCKGRSLGNGANGNVYEVYFPPAWRQKPMVVKETNYHYNREELEVYKSMGSHENIVDHYCVTFKGCEYKMAVFMEKCDKSLKDICEVRAMDTKEVMFYWTQVLAAVDHLHDKGIIHKDIKAKNILLSELPGQGENCRAKLADFDSAKKLETEFTQGGLRPMGTRGFAAPEVLEQKPHGRPADVYSMGCLLLELHGITPKQDPDELFQQVEQLCSRDPDQGQLVYHCVQQDHCNRPTVKEMINLPYVQGFLRVPDQL